MEEIDKTFKPTTEWMEEKYREMNDLLFNSKLGRCFFGIFTTGKGSEGRTLGWFKITGRNVKYNRRTGQMFKDYGYNDKVFVDSSNFFEVCEPKIELNGNYSGTENAFLATLVHEMCHYYTYMNGYVPKRAHGVEFKQIGSIVSARSNGMFTIQRLASAEQMNEMELNDEMKARKAKRLANMKASVSAVLVLGSDGTAALTITSDQNLISTIKSREEENGNDVFVSNNTDVIDFLFDKGYKSNMRLSRNSRTGRLSWRYWSLEGKPWLSELKQLFGIQSLSAGRQQPQEPEPVIKKPRRIFTLKTSNGVFECDADCPPAELFKKINERFPRFDADTIIMLMGNINNYRIEENRMSTKSIIKEVIQEFIDNEIGAPNDSADITSDMNLGEFSPLELA